MQIKDYRLNWIPRSFQPDNLEDTIRKFWRLIGKVCLELLVAATVTYLLWPVVLKRFNPAYQIAIVGPNYYVPWEQVLDGMQEAHTEAFLSDRLRKANVVLRFETDILDTGRAGSTTARSRELASMLVDDDEVIAVTGPPQSSVAKDVIGIYQDAGLPLILPVATDPSLTRPDPIAPIEKYYPQTYRLIPSNSEQASLFADFVKNQDAETLSVLGVLRDRANPIYSNTLSNSFLSALEDCTNCESFEWELQGGSVTKIETDFHEILEELASKCGKEEECRQVFVFYAGDRLPHIEALLQEVSECRRRSNAYPNCQIARDKNKDFSLLLPEGATASLFPLRDEVLRRIDEIEHIYVPIPFEGTELSTEVWDSGNFLAGYGKNALNMVTESLLDLVEEHRHLPFFDLRRFFRVSREDLIRKLYEDFNQNSDSAFHGGKALANPIGEVPGDYHLYRFVSDIQKLENQCNPTRSSGGKHFQHFCRCPNHASDQPQRGALASR
jgi:hypothetical protein